MDLQSTYTILSPMLPMSVSPVRPWMVRLKSSVRLSMPTQWQRRSKTVSQSTLSTTDALHGSLLIRQRFGKLKIIMTVVLLKVQMSIRLRKARRRLLILMRSSVILTDFTQLRRTSLTTMRPALPKELRSQEKQCLSALIARLHTLFIRL